MIRERDVNPLRVIWHSGAARTFLLFTSQEEAEKAVKALDGLSIMDRAVRVELAKGSQKNGPESGGDGDGPDVDDLTKEVEKVAINGKEEPAKVTVNGKEESAKVTVNGDQ